MKNLNTFLTSKGVFVGGVVILLLSTLISVFIPLVLKQLFDGSVSSEQFLPTIIIMASLLMLNVFVLTIGNALLSFEGERSVKLFRERLIKGMMNLRAGGVEHSDDVKIANHLTNDSEIIAHLISTTLPSIITSICGWLFAVIMLFVLNAKLTMLILSGVALVAVVIKFIGNKLGLVSEKFRQKLANLTSQVSNALQFNLDVKVSGASHWLYTQMFQENQSLYKTSLQGIKYRVTLLPFINGVLTLMLIVVATLGMNEIQAGTMTVGALIAFVMYLFQLIGPTLTLSSALGDLATENGALVKVLEIKEQFRAEASVQLCNQKDATHPFGVLKSVDEIVFDHVTIVHNVETIVQDVSFKLNKGYISVLVGPSGVGKTSLVYACLKAMPISEGEIKINQTALATISEVDWFNHVGYVNQNPFILEGASVYDNLTLGKEIDTGKLDEVLVSVGLFDELSEKNGGHYIIASQGSLSGGQKQRLAIGRALLEAKHVLILDEITSALDDENERQIIALIESIKQDYVILEISHRQQVIAHADQVIRLG